MSNERRDIDIRAMTGRYPNMAKLPHQTIGRLEAENRRLLSDVARLEGASLAAARYIKAHRAWAAYVRENPYTFTDTPTPPEHTEVTAALNALCALFPEDAARSPAPGEGPTT